MKKHFLFIGTSGSRAEKIRDFLEDYENIEARAVALFPLMCTPLTSESIRWANKIFIINEKEELHKTQLLQRFPYAEEKEIIDLNLSRGDIEENFFDKKIKKYL